MGRFSERRSATPAGNCTGSYSAAGDDAEHWPVLVEFLNLQKFVDGSPRLTGTLLVFVQDGMLKAMLKDREEGLIGFKSYDSLDGLLDALENDLRDDLVDWRKERDQWQKRKN